MLAIRSTPRIVSALVVACALLSSGCGGQIQAPSDASPAANVSLVRNSFDLPGDGTPNANGWIGPFCCTGHTVTVESSGGFAVGYAYFFSWKGQAYMTDATHSVAPDFGVLVAGLANVQDPGSELVKGEIDFAGSDMLPGASRSVTVGQVTFVVSIEHAELHDWNGVTYYDMGSLKAKLDVSVAG
jgi:hypothetical protein